MAIIIGERPIFELHHSASHIIPNTLPMMSWELSKSGMIIGLDKHIPVRVVIHPILSSLPTCYFFISPFAVVRHNK
jgi:predicted naringenin-chalcone synthase